MRYLILTFLFIMSSVSAQTIDYNIKKGYAANGYDVVAYFNNTAIKGNKRFTALFDGISYAFSTEKNLKLFNKNPEQYMPQYGGYCAYAVAIKRDKVSINPKTFQIKDGKLYLFYNAWGTNTLALWQQENDTLLAKKADSNWSTIKFKNK